MEAKFIKLSDLKEGTYIPSKCVLPSADRYLLVHMLEVYYLLLLVSPRCDHLLSSILLQITKFIWSVISVTLI